MRYFNCDRKDVHSAHDYWRNIGNPEYVHCQGQIQGQKPQAPKGAQIVRQYCTWHGQIVTESKHHTDPDCSVVPLYTLERGYEDREVGSAQEAPSEALRAALTEITEIASKELDHARPELFWSRWALENVRSIARDALK